MLALRDSPFCERWTFLHLHARCWKLKRKSIVFDPYIGATLLQPVYESSSTGCLAVWVRWKINLSKSLQWHREKFVKVFEQIFLSRCITTCNLTHSIAAVSWTPRVGATPNKFPFTAQAWGAYALQSWTKGMSRLMTELFWHQTNLGFVALWISCSIHLLSERQRGSKFENVNLYEVNKWKNISKLEFDSPE